MIINNSRLHLHSLIVSNNADFKVTTIRKSGTNLLNKILKIIGIPNQKIYPQIHIDNMDVEHLKPDVNYIVSIRDPRDSVISLANWIINNKAIEISKQKGHYSAETHQKLLRMNLSERIDYVFTMSHFFKGFENVLKAKERFSENVYIFKFEDFIGPQFGGSSKQVQIETIQKITRLCHRNLNKSQIQKIAVEMIGETPTYTKKKDKVGAWKTILNDKQIEIIKTNLNEFLLTFGYETDANWDVDFLHQRNNLQANQKSVI